MTIQISAFKVEVNGRVLDYRLGADLDLGHVKAFFSKKYKVKTIYSGGRHVLGVLEKSGRECFLKLATTEGISVVTKNEYDWNSEFNTQVKRTKSKFWVPLNYDCGYFQGNLFYLITDKFEGEFLSSWPDVKSANNLSENISDIIAFSNLIQSLKPKSSKDNSDNKKWFVDKTKTWLDSMSNQETAKYDLEGLFKIVTNGVSSLEMKPRHGDFTPWHLIRLNSGQLGLIDGEHAKLDAVELYDIGYFIQRVFGVLKAPSLAASILKILQKEGADISKLKVILAARAIGGFLDEFLTARPDYEYADIFRRWVISK